MTRQASTAVPPYIVAELNTSHFGDVSIAQEMIDSAKLAGADCVKFQSWSPESLYSSNYLRSNSVTARMFKKLSMGQNQLLELSNYCHEVGIGFSSTPYSLHEAEFLAKIPEVPFIKVASMDIVNTEFLEGVAKLNKPIVLSTGMADLAEIDTAVGILQQNDADFALLHCVSVYPTPVNLLSLKNIPMLIQRYPSIPIGFSDHSQTPFAAAAAVALGASIIEKHFTLDKTRLGMDNQMASQPSEFHEMVQACAEVHAGLGTFERVISHAEFQQRATMRRSLVSSHDLPAGHVLRTQDIEYKRPGVGLPLSSLNSLLGGVLKYSIEAGEAFKIDEIAFDESQRD